MRFAASCSRAPGQQSRRRQVLDIFEHSPTSPMSCCAIPELLDEIGEPFQLGRRTRSRTAPRCAASTAARCCASRAKACSDAAPIFTTLGKTSRLADCVIAAAYRIALTESPPPASAGLHAARPDDGDRPRPPGHARIRPRLRRRPDLRHPDADAAEHVFWTGVAERMIQTLSSYTGEGVMFTVDTRLRPNGREGDLVQTEGAYKTYFASQRRSLGRHHLHESRAPWPATSSAPPNSCTSCRRWTGAATARACARARSWPKCARAWSASRARAIRSRPAWAAITTSISR